MNVKAILKDKRTWLIAGGVGIVGLLIYARAGGGRAQADDGDDAIDYQLGYYLPGGGGLPVGTASNDNTGVTDKMFNVAAEAQKLQANMVYAGVWSEMVNNLTDDLAKAKKPGAAGTFNFGGQSFGFDFSFKAPTTPVKAPSSNGTTVHTTTKVFQNNDDRRGAGINNQR